MEERRKKRIFVEQSSRAYVEKAGENNDDQQKT